MQKKANKQTKNLDTNFIPFAQFNSKMDHRYKCKAQNYKTRR